MGYSHYYYRPEEISEETFDAIGKDIKTVLSYLTTNHDLHFGNGNGEGEPEISDKLIAFNGIVNCGHEQRDFGIAWPSDVAGIEDADEAVAGRWGFGAKLSRRACGGDCTYEPFWLERTTERRGYDDSALCFSCSKTAYKPYDIGVTAACIVLKHYLKTDAKITSDGDMPQWYDGMLACQSALGYGLDFTLDE